MERQSQRAKNSKHIVAVLEEFKWNNGDLAKALGVVNSTVSNWITGDSPPAWTTLAVECLRRRAGRLKKSSKLLIATVPTPNIETVETIIENIGGKVVTFNLEDFQ